MPSVRRTRLTNAKQFDPTDSLRKTDDLFRDRFVTLLAKAVLDREEYSHWRTSAAGIQQAIYSIDTYYELSETVSVTATEKPLWDLVESRIADANGRVSFSVWKSFSELR